MPTDGMRLRRFTFRILFPLIYLPLAVMPIVGMIITIAEGPNPFGFLYYLSAPGFYLLHLLDPILPGVDFNFWLEVPVVLIVNCILYFLLGYLIDYIIIQRVPIKRALERIVS